MLLDEDDDLLDDSDGDRGRTATPGVEDGGTCVNRQRVETDTTRRNDDLEIDRTIYEEDDDDSWKVYNCN